MREMEPSQTAFAAAAHRAAHQLLEQGRIFADPLALAILGQDARTVAEKAQARPSQRGMRLFIAARSRFAETSVSSGVATRGVRQLVMLGAGLDTFAYRSPLAFRLRVFEVDHPATQAWKRRRLAESGIALPPTLAFAPVDFDRDSLLGRLVEAGFDPARRSVFTWLGVVPYLTTATVRATLQLIGALPGGAEVVFDYGDPPATLSPDALAAHEDRATRVAALGEPFLSHFEPAVLHEMLRELGFSEIEDRGPKALFEAYFAAALPAARTVANGALPERGGHVIFAATPARPQSSTGA